MINNDTQENQELQENQDQNISDPSNLEKFLHSPPTDYDTERYNTFSFVYKIDGENDIIVKSNNTDSYIRISLSNDDYFLDIQREKVYDPELVEIDIENIIFQTNENGITHLLLEYTKTEYKVFKILGKKHIILDFSINQKD